MRKIKIAIGKIIYCLLAKHLPVSYNVMGGGIAKWLRKICGKLILEHCGKKVNIERGAIFSSHVSLGDYSGIGINASISGTVVIGDNVMMGPHCTMYSRNHAFDRTDVPMCGQGFSKEEPIIISDDVWMGGHVIILPGVHIGDSSIIGAGSVVNKDIPDNVIAAGNPCKVIREITEADIVGMEEEIRQM